MAACGAPPDPRKVDTILDQPDMTGNPAEGSQITRTARNDAIVGETGCPGHGSEEDSFESLCEVGVKKAPVRRRYHWTPVDWLGKSKEIEEKIDAVDVDNVGSVQTS